MNHDLRRLRGLGLGAALLLLAAGPGVAEPVPITGARFFQKRLTHAALQAEDPEVGAALRTLLEAGFATQVAEMSREYSRAIMPDRKIWLPALLQRVAKNFVEEGMICRLDEDPYLSEPTTTVNHRVRPGEPAWSPYVPWKPAEVPVRFRSAYEAPIDGEWVGLERDCKGTITVDPRSWEVVGVEADCGPGATVLLRSPRERVPDEG